MRTLFSFGTSTFLLASLMVSGLQAQYGPKDGQNLPPSDLDRIQAGQTAPDFTLPKLDGSGLALSSLRGKNVVLVFYRGHW